MPRPFGSTITLADDVRTQLEALLRARSTPQALVLRCRIVLRAAASDQPANQRIAAEMDCNRHTVALWRERFAAAGLAGLQDAPRSGRPRSFSPEAQVAVLALASSTTQEHHNPDSSWSLDELARTIVNEAAHQAMSRATIWRILDAADLKPHKSVYWLNSHDPDFDTKAQDICQLYVNAATYYEQGRLVLCGDEKTGMQILQRKYPTRLALPGQPEQQEFEYVRHGTRCLLTTWCVPTGQVVWNLGPTRTSADWVAHLRHVVQQFPDQRRYDWVVDNLNTHWSLEVCHQVARWCGLSISDRLLRTGRQRRAFLSDPEHEHVFHFTPSHGSWLNQVELFFSVLVRRFLKRGDFSRAEEFVSRLETWLERYNRVHAHPYRWTYTGEPLVRATPFSQTRRQQRRGRAWFGTRPPLFERLLFPPRPYKRKVG